jgi:membrane protein implicated in regulation of membrane protease activity
MLAANVWHWWIGVVLTLVVVLAVVVLVAMYLKSVTAQKHPSRKQQRHQHSDL